MLARVPSMTDTKTAEVKRDEKELVSIMSSSPMTYGWDVVSCMDAKKITDLFAELYQVRNGYCFHFVLSKH